MGDTTRNQVSERGRLVVRELASVFDNLDGAELDTVVRQLISAKRVFLSGQGRSGLIVKAIGIRLMHIGLAVFVAGETNTPAVGAGDVLVAVSASAKTAVTLNHLSAARKAGAKSVIVTTVPAPVEGADFCVTLPIRRGVETIQHAGSLFEQSVLLIGDCLAWQIQHAMGADDAALNARHANLQ